MALRSGSGLWLFLLGCVLVSGTLVAAQLGYWRRLEARLFPPAKGRLKLSPGDFPAGVAAPVGDIAAVPLRPTLIGFTPRGSAASLLYAAGGAISPEAPGKAQPTATGGLFKSAYALDARAVVYAR